jgi:hypothetical protein
MPVVAHEAEGDELQLGEGKLLSQELAELLFGDVVKDHLPVQSAGDEMNDNERRVDGLEDAKRSHELCSYETIFPVAQQEDRSFASIEHPESWCSYVQVV